MRQLVAVATDESLRYFVADGEHVEQIAQIANSGLDVADIIQLGNVLSEALQLNGHRARARARHVEHPVPVVAVAPAGPIERRSRVKQMPNADERAARRRAVLAYLGTHPDAKVHDIARHLAVADHIVGTVLGNLLSEGLVTRRPVLSSKRRPANLYSLVPS